MQTSVNSCTGGCSKVAVTNNCVFPHSCTDWGHHPVYAWRPLTRPPQSWAGKQLPLAPLSSNQLLHTLHLITFTAISFSYHWEVKTSNMPITFHHSFWKNVIHASHYRRDCLSSPLINFPPQLRSIERPLNVPDSGLICDVLWADPEEVRESTCLSVCTRFIMKNII